MSADKKKYLACAIFDFLLTFGGSGAVIVYNYVTPENSAGYKISLTGIILVVAMIMVAKSIFEGNYRKKLDTYLQQLAEATDAEVKGAISKEINSLKTKQDIYERLVLLLPFVIILLLTTIAVKWLKDLQASVGLVTACIAGGSVFNIIKRPIKERVRLEKITEKAKIKN